MAFVGQPRLATVLGQRSKTSDARSPSSKVGVRSTQFEEQSEQFDVWRSRLCVKSLQLTL